MDQLDQPLVGGLNLRHLIMLGVGLAVLVYVVRLLRGRSASGGNHLIRRRCRGCHWTGEVSQYNKKCPKCGAAIE